MMNINLKRCFFHSIEPIRKKNDKISRKEGCLERLHLMLKSGYLVPGYQLKDTLPNIYDEIYRISGDDCVYLAQHSDTELPSYGGSFFNGEFSAYLEHIVNRPAWVFDEFIVNDKKIKMKSHFLSEEVCVQEPIDLHDAIAIMLPYETPASYMRRILLFKEFYEKDLLDLDKDKIENIVNDKDNLIRKSYEEINPYKELLQLNFYDTPLVDVFGYELAEEKESLWIENNEKEIKQLMKNR